MLPKVTPDPDVFVFYHTAFHLSSKSLRKIKIFPCKKTLQFSTGRDTLYAKHNYTHLREENHHGI